MRRGEASRHASIRRRGGKRIRDPQSEKGKKKENKKPREEVKRRYLSSKGKKEEKLDLCPRGMGEI